MTYSTVVYKLNRRSKKGDNVISSGNINFPQRLPFETMADLMVRGQGICFKDGNVNNENKKRIVDMFKRKSNEQPTIALIMSMGFLEDESNIFSANDMGALTLQKGEIGLMTGDNIPGNEKVYWINEVCRSLFNKEKVPRSDGPIPSIMAYAEQFARAEGERMLFLMVEKNPEHGDGNVLLQYYSTGFKGKGGYGYQIMGEDAEYWFMGKDLSIHSVATDIDVSKPSPAAMQMEVIEEVVTPIPGAQQTLMERLEEDMPDAGFAKRKTRYHRHKKHKKKTKKHKKKHHKTKKHNKRKHRRTNRKRRK